MSMLIMCKLKHPNWPVLFNIQAWIQTDRYACMHVRTHVQAHTQHKCTRAHTNTNVHKRACTNTYTQHTYTHTHAHMHATHVRAHKHAQTRAQTHTCAHIQTEEHAHKCYNLPETIVLACFSFLCASAVTPCCRKAEVSYLECSAKAISCKERHLPRYTSVHASGHFDMKLTAFGGGPSGWKACRHEDGRG